MQKKKREREGSPVGKVHPDRNHRCAGLLGKVEKCVGGGMEKPLGGGSLTPSMSAFIFLGTQILPEMEE